MGRPDENDDEAVTVSVADGSPLFRIGLVEVLGSQPPLRVVASASDGDDALGAIRDLRPDVALLETGLPGRSGMEILELVKRDTLPTRIVLLAPDIDEAQLYRAMALGVGGYLAKRSEPEEVRRAATAVAGGETVIGEGFQTGLAAEIRLREGGGRPVLTDRERQVLALTADGGSVSEVAGRLQLSDATIKTHLQHAYAKLDVTDRAAAVARAMRFGLID